MFFSSVFPSSFGLLDPDVRETTNQSINAAYNDRSCYRPCTLDYSLEPDIDPSVCVASLTLAAGDNEEDDDRTIISDTSSTSLEGARLGDCTYYKNGTARDDEDMNQSQFCQPESDSLDQDDQRRITPMPTNSACWTCHHLCFGWRWRTSVLPYSLLFILWFFFRHLFGVVA